MNALQKQMVLEVVIAELERSLKNMDENYRRAVSNLSWLRQCVDTDDLTRLLRRNAFIQRLNNLLFTSRAEGREVCVLMIDIDYFKRVNDTFGHQTGDVVLERVSELIRSYLRPQDLAGRFGGEEIIVAVQASRSEAISIAERIRNAVQEFTMISKSLNSEFSNFQVTLSVGLASAYEFKFEADVLIGRADEALYQAKRSGRNKVEIAQLPPSSSNLVAMQLEVSAPRAA